MDTQRGRVRARHPVLNSAKLIQSTLAAGLVDDLLRVAEQALEPRMRSARQGCARA
jgi:hypothetical protein